MSEYPSPAHAIVAWMEDLPDRGRHGIMEWLRSIYPTAFWANRSKGLSAEHTEESWQALRVSLQDASRMPLMGLALQLAAGIDCFVAGMERDPDAAEARQRAMARDMRATGFDDLANKFEETINPFNNRSMATLAREWDDFSAPLTSANIHAWCMDSDGDWER